MTVRIGKVVIIAAEESRECELCGKMKECRPAGPAGEQVCHPCAMLDERALRRYLDTLMNGGATIH